MTARVTLVLARADNGIIGNRGQLPWRISEDLKRFKALTMGKPVVMGRKTWDSLPKRPLTGRQNIVITRNANFRADGAVVARSLDEALAAAGDAVEIMVIGGAEIYRMALARADRIELTEVELRPEGDVTLPPFDVGTWREMNREPHVTADGLRYAYVTLTRV